MGTNPNELRRLQNSSITPTAAVSPTSSVLTVRDTADDSGRRIAIIGATIGGVIFCVVLPLFLIVFWQRARRDRRVRNNVEDAIDPMTIPNPNPLLSEPIFTQISRSPSPSPQTGTMSISTIEFVALDPGPTSDTPRRLPQSSRIAFEAIIEWLQREIGHTDGKGIMYSASPAPPSYYSLHRTDIPDPSCSSSPPP